MNKNPAVAQADSGAHSGADAAIARVLAAERQALQAIDAARVQAQHSDEAARAAARALAERTERRLRRVGEAFDEHTRQALAQLDDEATRWAQAGSDAAADHDAVEQAVARLARELIGAPR